MTPRTCDAVPRAGATPGRSRDRAGRRAPGRGAGASPASRPSARPGVRVATVVATAALLAGLGAGAVVRAAGAGGDPEGASTSAAGVAGTVATADDRSAAGSGSPDGTTGTPGTAGAAGTPGTGVAAGTPGTGAAAGTPGTGAAAADVRPLPLPQLVDRDAVGPLWLTPADREAGLLSLDVPRAASGVLDVVPGADPAPGPVGVRTVRVEVERGLPVDAVAFAATVMATLNAPRGWGAHGDLSFARTDGPAEIRVVLASPDLVDALCAPLDTGGEVSCGRNGHAALNLRRWALATDEFPDRTLYRQYLVNHEVGHLLGHPHERCPGEGQPAPLMQQQSLGVAPCLPNGWPYP